ncbi:hypothetical protein AB2B38_007010 [Balneola sp. MJW-20]|uniref:hypothetical protein n=1 Tax=Gracilimonas aurantiaca TaxID=3234185 RepID=UPI00346755B1
MKHTISTLFLVILLISCNSQNDKEATDAVSVRLGELTDVEIINDEMSFIDGLYSFLPISEGRAIISDGKPGLFLLEDNVLTQQYGRSGSGPCEYNQISGTDLLEDTLYVLDNSQTKIISFDINSAECIGEFTSEGLNRFDYLHKLRNSDGFIAANGSYLGIMPDSTSLLRKIYEDGSYEDLGLYLGRINTVRSVVRLRTPGLSFVKYDNGLYTYFPLNDSLRWYDLDTGKLTAFDLDIEIQRDEMEDATEAAKILDAINEGYTFVTRIIATEDWVAVTTAQNQPGDLPQRKILKFYRHDGSFIDEVPYEDNFVGQADGRLIQIIENTDPESDMAYSIGYRDVIFE